MIVWIAFILLEVVRNFHLIEVEKTKPIYIQSFIFRGAAAIFHGIYMGVTDFQTWIPILIFQVTSFWLIFDPLLNIGRKKPLFYKGKDSGWLDKLPNGIYFSLKFIALLLLIAIFTGINILEYVNI